jgi:hypothetical protein
MRILCSLLAVLSTLPNPAQAAEVSHCKGSEAVVFNCRLGGGKHVSVCASKPLTAAVGYLQYRFGPPGHVELRYPQELASTRKQFTFGTLAAPTAESEHLDFRRGDFRYSVYRRVTNVESGNGGGVTVSRISSGEVVAAMECHPPGTLPRMGLEGIVPQAE